MNVLEIFKNLNEDFAVATIVWSKSGSEVKVGDKLILTSNGKIYGDFKSSTSFVLEKLKKALETSESFLISYSSCNSEKEATCGTKFQAFIEFFGGFPKVHIFGAGDIGLFTYQILKSLNFDALIYDDEKPSEEVDVKFLNYKNIDVKVSPKDYLIIVTRGHRNDYDVLKFVFNLDFQPKYIGLLGSKAKNDILKDKLFDEGYTIRYWDNIKTPIGLDIIKARTPKEIAVAIVAEILSIKNGGDL